MSLSRLLTYLAVRYLRKSSSLVLRNPTRYHEEKNRIKSMKDLHKAEITQLTTSRLLQERSTNKAITYAELRAKIAETEINNLRKQFALYIRHINNLGSSLFSNERAEALAYFLSRNIYKKNPENPIVIFTCRDNGYSHLTSSVPDNFPYMHQVSKIEKLLTNRIPARLRKGRETGARLKINSVPITLDYYMGVALAYFPKYKTSTNKGPIKDEVCGLHPNHSPVR